MGRRPRLRYSNSILRYKEAINLGQEVIAFGGDQDEKVLLADSFDEFLQQLHI